MLSQEIEYLTGVENDVLSNQVDHSQHEINIQEGQYAVFTHHGDLQDIWTTISYIWQIWAVRTKNILRDAPDFEIYDDRFDQKNLTGAIEIWVPIE